MVSIYLIIVVVLMLLAASDLIVGVINDAVNFLNSAIGSKAAPFWIIMVVASLGILVGSTFSDGMMEVARTGIFHPQLFTFKEIMFIFFAVMITDVILLDTFNTFGLPTSTTVSIVFDLLGAAVGIAMIKINNGEMGAVTDYINTSKALVIISSILLSVVFAFVGGLVLQSIVRIFFTFNYTKTIKYFGGLWGGIAITGITYFMLIKGAKGSSFLTKDDIHWISEHSKTIIAICFAFWFVVMQLLASFTKVNILKIVVLIGTFALAMAFAGNDLVNFIGVPLAGLKAYEIYTQSGDTLMTALTEEVKTPTLYLVISGLLMVIAMWVSKKARTVTLTSINLARQDEGYERFDSNAFSRSLVRTMVYISDSIQSVLPKKLNKIIKRRLDISQSIHVKEENAMFDLLRASVNLAAASIIISYGTSQKLPLSTTYVTFMVAMATSLADGAWGRDSAVYRISGVISVIMGWFVTALVAFTVSFIIAIFLYKAGVYAVIILIIATIYVLYRGMVLHRKRELQAAKLINESKNMIGNDQTINSKNIFTRCNNEIIGVLTDISRTYNNALDAMVNYDRTVINDLMAETQNISLTTKGIKNGVPRMVSQLKEDDFESGPFYVQVIDYMQEVVNAHYHIVMPFYKHIANSHKPLSEEQVAEVNQLNLSIFEYFNVLLEIIRTYKYVDIEKLAVKQQEVMVLIKNFRKNQIKRIKLQQVGTRNSNLYLNLLNESKNLLLHSSTLVKAQKDFVVFNSK